MREGFRLTNKKQLMANLTKFSERAEKVIETRLRLIGLQFVRDARLKADFTDRTGNLRSSIGFIITKDGKVVYEDFERTKNGADGYTSGRDFAKRVAGEVSGRWVLIVVAGMEYAAAVESKGFDVITGSSMEAESRLREAFKGMRVS